MGGEELFGVAQVRRFCRGFVSVAAAAALYWHAQDMAAGILGTWITLRWSLDSPNTDHQTTLLYKIQLSQTRTKATRVKFKNTLGTSIYMRGMLRSSCVSFRGNREATLLEEHLKCYTKTHTKHDPVSHCFAIQALHYSWGSCSL